MARTLAESLADEPFSLALSSGYFGFFAHTGFLRALTSTGLRPARISGSSAGGLVAACYAAGMAADDLASELSRLRKHDFWDPGLGFGLLRGKLFEQLLTEILPVKTFEECTLPCSLSVFHIRSRQTRVLDSGPLNVAIRATCALPGLFHPVAHESGRLWDGGIADRPGVLGIQNESRVLVHNIQSRSSMRRTARRLVVNSVASSVTTQSIEVAFENLPRVGPNELHLGMRALQETERRMHARLDSSE